MPRVPKAAYAILPLAILAWLVRSWTADPPPSIQATVNTPERMVIDLITAPGPVRVRRGESILTLPGVPTRWLAAEVTPTGATVGWATNSDGSCTETLSLPGPSGRVILYPLDAPQVAGIELWPGIAPGPQRERIVIESETTAP